MQRLVCSLLLLTALGACAKPQAGIKIEYVDRPVIQVEKCIDRKDIPQRPEKLGALPDELDTALAVTLAKVSEWIRYGNKTDAVVDSCAK